MLPPRPWHLPCSRFSQICAALVVGSSVCASGSFLAAQSTDESLPAPSAISENATAAPSLDPRQVVREVRIVGNQTIPTAQVEQQLRTRAGREFDEIVIQRDVKQLATLGWFVNVRPLVESAPTGRIVIFEVTERPTNRYVNYLGNIEVSDKTLAKQTNLKAGGAVEPYAVEEGRRKLQDYYASKGYNNAQITILEGAKPSDQGVVYLINEGRSQKIWKVGFVGNDFVSASRLKTLIKSKPPVLKLFRGYLDREQIDADVELLTEYYRAYGYFQATVSRKLDADDDGEWVNLTFVIHEGMRYKVRDVRLMGNTIFQHGPLAEQVQLKSGELYEQAKQRRDSQWLQELYGSHGYVFADIKAETVFLEEPGQVDLLYHIDEGRQWRVGRIIVHIGGDNPHTRIQTALNRITLRPGEILDIRELKASERRLVASSLFHTDAATGVRPKITYRIPEDADLRLSSKSPANGELRGQSPVVGGPRMLPPPRFRQGNSEQAGARQVVHFPTDRAGLQVDRGVAIDIHCADAEHYRRWIELEATEEARPEATIPNLPDAGSSPAPSPSPAEPVEHRGDAANEPLYRGQSPSPQPSSNSLWWTRPRTDASQQPASPPEQAANASPTPLPAATRGPYDALALRGQSPSGNSNATYSQVGNALGAYGGQRVGSTGPVAAPTYGPGTQPIYQSVQQAQYTQQLQPPAGSIAPTPLSPLGPLPLTPMGPDSPLLAPGVPYYPEGTVDVLVDASETQTGRLMVGVGVNSDAGVVGNISIDERNFDWRQWPTSFEDLRNGTAFRGDGQRLRIDASPGSQVSRYLVSFQEPYLWDRPISLGLSGSYFDRRYRDWDEQRMGGRVSLGYQWVERDLSASVSYRGENVNVRRPSVPALPELAEVLGDNALHGFKLTVINDTRDSAFLPTQGHYLELGGEQVIGTFDYPRFDADFRKYFLMHERPDHSGRHVLSASTNVAYTGSNTPIYEHYFAGGFATFRGFDFRGASPVDAATNVQVGGEFQWLNTVQYLFPITADEMLHGVVFCDFGTVERKVEIKDFRVAPGLGLRITVPAMGPAPIALDFAWATNHASLDDRQVFTFSLGFSR